MTYKMIDKNVLVRPIYETTTDSGIVIKMDILPKTLKGNVLAVSEHPDCSEVSVGDIVYFHKHAGTNFKDGNEILRIIPIVDIEAVEVKD